MKKIAFIYLLCMSCAVSLLADGIPNRGQLDNVGGIGGKRGFSGDGGDALLARLGSPMGIAVDRVGNIYFSDTANHRVRRIDIRTGEINTVAGTGKKGFYNDGGNAEMATLNAPTGLAFDSLGNLYIADTGNQRVRMLTPNGYLYTVAGDGRKGYNGNGLRPKASSLKNPTGVAISPKGELYISDTGNHVIRKISRQDGSLINVAGSATYHGNDGDRGLAEDALLKRPSALIFDKYGNLFIADTGNQQIRWIEPKKNLIFTIAGTGKKGFIGEGDRKATDCAFNNPTGLALDKRGRLYISDTDNQRIRRMTVEADVILDSKLETVIGTGERGYNGDGLDAWDTKLAYPGALVITPFDQLYFVDTGNNLIRRVWAVSGIQPPVEYNAFGRVTDEPKDKRNFLQVLFGAKK